MIPSTPEPDPLKPAPAAAEPDAATATRDDLVWHQPGDRWAHRRLEPRGLAIIWSAFLFFLTITIFAGAPLLQSSATEHARFNARLMLQALTIGVVILWPLLRLSQATPIRGFTGGGGRDAGIVGDLLVILAPAQAIIWPQATPLLAGWPRDVVACAACWIAAWALVVGGVLALALRPRSVEDLRAHRPDTRPRWAWMLLVIAASLVGAVVSLIASPKPQTSIDAGARRVFNAAWMWSPFTGVAEIARDRAWTGRAAKVSPGHWRATGLVVLAALPIWAFALIRAGPRHPGRVARASLG